MKYFITTLQIFLILSVTLSISYAESYTKEYCSVNEAEQACLGDGGAENCCNNIAPVNQCVSKYSCWAGSDYITYKAATHNCGEYPGSCDPIYDSWGCGCTTPDCIIYVSASTGGKVCNSLGCGSTVDSDQCSQTFWAESDDGYSFDYWEIPNCDYTVSGNSITISIETAVGGSCSASARFLETPYQECPGGTAVECNDEDPCTDDVCVNGICAWVDNGVCEQSCTSIEDCYPEGGPVECVEYYCNSGKCFEYPVSGCGYCTDESECDDRNICTDDICVDGECDHPEKNASWAIDGCGTCTESNISNCDDYIPGTRDYCLEGRCAHAEIPGYYCDTAHDCDDDDPCTDDVCVNGRCANPDVAGCNSTGDCTINSDCYDDDPCTDDVCVAGACKHPDIPDCESADGNGDWAKESTLQEQKDIISAIDGEIEGIAGDIVVLTELGEDRNETLNDIDGNLSEIDKGIEDINSGIDETNEKLTGIDATMTGMKEGIDEINNPNPDMNKYGHLMTDESDTDLMGMKQKSEEKKQAVNDQINGLIENPQFNVTDRFRVVMTNPDCALTVDADQFGTHTMDFCKFSDAFETAGGFFVAFAYLTAAYIVYGGRRR